MLVTATLMKHHPCYTILQGTENNLDDLVFVERKKTLDPIETQIIVMLFLDNVPSHPEELTYKEKKTKILTFCSYCLASTASNRPIEG